MGRTAYPSIRCGRISRDSTKPILRPKFAPTGDGEREEITMQPFVQDLTDQDIEDLAAWYASLYPCP